MSYLDADRFAQVQREVPIACVDLLCVFDQRDERGEPALLLIERSDAAGRAGVLNLVGGRIRRDESIEAAATRHLRETLGPEVEPAPREWGRPEWVAVYPQADHGPGPFDPRQHAISPSYLLHCSGEPRVEPGGEAEALHWFDPADPPAAERYGFGQGAVVTELLSTLDGA
jgi:ADP-ribose pyrophosphatase YjhB (NUDIX family)